MMCQKETNGQCSKLIAEASLAEIDVAARAFYRSPGAVKNFSP
jgi:hypothetical protein